MERPGMLLAGKYRLERYLGRGGFASVWEAQNVFIDRRVALKILSTALLQSPGAVERFVREAKLAAKEIHPTVVRVEDMGQTGDGAPFLVMELLDGEPLDKVLCQGKPLPLEQVLACAGPLLEGLAAAHERGIIHRDIKPGNIFLVSSDSSGPPIRILDMGIAKDLGDPSRLTYTGQIVGTIRYLPPEVLLNPCAENWRPSVDVFAMGMVLFKMLTGRLPFEPTTASSSPLKVVQQLEAYDKYTSSSTEMPGPASFDDTVPASIDAFVRKALALEWGERFQDAREMLLGFDDATHVAGLLVGEMSGEGLIHELREGVAEDPGDQDTVELAGSGASFVEPSFSRRATIKMVVEESTQPTVDDPTDPLPPMSSLASPPELSRSSSEPLSIDQNQEVLDVEPAEESEVTRPDANALTIKMPAAVDLDRPSPPPAIRLEDSKEIPTLGRRIRWIAKLLAVAAISGTVAAAIAWGFLDWRQGQYGTPRTAEAAAARTSVETGPAAHDGGIRAPVSPQPISDAGLAGSPREAAVSESEHVGVEPPPPRLVTVSILGLPDGARVTFAGRRIDDDQIVASDGTTGALEIRAPGYERYRRQLTLREGATVELRGALRRARSGDATTE